MPASARRRLPTLLLAAFALLAGLFAPAAQAAPTPGTVTLLIWEEFLSPKVVKILKNRYGLEIRQITFTSPEQRERLLAEQAGHIDIIVADTIALESYLTRGLLARIDGSRLPNLKHVMVRWQTNTDHAVPYLWGQTGIAWRTDLVETPVTSYAQLLELARARPGKVALLADVHEALMAVRFADGQTEPMRTPADVQAARKLLMQQRPNLRFIGAELGLASPLATGAVIAAQAYNGDVAFLRDNFKVPLAFATPNPGCMIWQEHLMLLRNAPNPRAAYEFLNRINEAEIAARNATEVHYATSNVLAVSRLDAEFRNDPVIRPTFDGLEDCYFYPSFSGATRQALNAVTLEPR